MAGCFSISERNISIFREELIKNYEKNYFSSIKESSLYLDSIIAPSALNEDFFNEINCLAPFGSGNPEPKFVIENVKVLSTSLIGNSHFKTTLLGKDGRTFLAFTWNAKNTPLEKYLDKNLKKKINIAGNIRLNEWRGDKEVQFIIEDISLSIA